MGFIVITILAVAIVSALVFFSRIADNAGERAPAIVLVTIASIVSVIYAFYFTFSIIQVVPVGYTYVGSTFGNVEERSYDSGLNIVNPLTQFEGMNIRQRIAEFQGGGNDSKENSEEVIASSSNNLVLTIDVTFAYALNPQYAWWIFQHKGNDDTYYKQLIVQAARDAIRDATAGFTDTEATTSKREELAQAMEKRFSELLIVNLTKSGMTEEQAAQVFTILPVQLRKVLPPAKVQNAIAERAAADQDLQRQVTLTEIAAQEAKRRENEGMGVRFLFDQLPKNFTAGEITQVLGALANKERADAMLKAVEGGHVNVMVLGNETPAVSLPNATPAVAPATAEAAPQGN